MSALTPRIDELEAIVQLQNQNVQGTFVDASKISVPNTAIINRAMIPDPANDLGVRFGVNRFPVLQIYPLQNEFGANGETVWALVNDDQGLVRLVGSWNSLLSTTGFGASTIGLNDYIEITFYGTGLNLLANYGFAYDFRATVDGGAEGSNIFPATSSSILVGRNYSPNQIVSVVSGLTLGVHTVKLRNNNANGINLFGFEILNTNSTTLLNVRPGIGLGNNSKSTLSAVATSAFNSTFESGALSTRGGRVVVYVDLNGAVKKAVQPTNTSRQDLNSADHSNEEIVRVYHWREFGVGRTDDFSRNSGTSTAERVYTLEDGTTSLVARNLAQQEVNSFDGFYTPLTTDYFTFTFVGTGLDVLSHESSTGSVDPYNVTVDGTLIGALDTTAINGRNRVLKVVSGLPYGTHSVRFQRTAVTAGRGYSKFYVYGPKKPTLPIGSVEIADYNVMADYVANTTGTVQPSQGVLRKASLREFAYVGAGWSISTTDSQFGGGVNVLTNTATNYVEHTFYGTGVEAKHFFASSAAPNWTYSIDGITNLTGAGYTTAVHAINIGSVTLNGATGVLSGTASASSSYGVTIRIQGIPLGLHKLRITFNSGAPLYIDTFDVTTPIHSPKSNVATDIQNSFPVGSNGLGDPRRFGAIVNKKNISLAFAITTNITTTATAAVPMQDMSVVHSNTSGRIKISYNVGFAHNTASGQAFFQVYVDGYPVGQLRQAQTGATNQVMTISDQIFVPVSPGTHKVDLYWYQSGGTAAAGAGGPNRTFLVEEV